MTPAYPQPYDPAAVGVGYGSTTIMVDTVLSMGAVNKQSGPIRWDLKSMNNFPQWEFDTRRAIRAVAVPGFLESKRPSQPELQQAPGSKRQNTSGQQDTKTVLLKVQEEWD